MSKQNIIDKLRGLESVEEAESDNKETKSSDNASDNASDKTSVQYGRVQTLLKNPIWNHAAIIKKLWGKKTATERSLFRKKLNRMDNDSGSKYEFTEEEISEILSILSNAASAVTHDTKKGDY